MEDTMLADTLSPVGRGKGEGVSASQFDPQSPLILSFSPPGRRDADPETFKFVPRKSLQEEEQKDLQRRRPPSC
jgi:hypothetical protein